LSKRCSEDSEKRQPCEIENNVKTRDFFIEMKLEFTNIRLSEYLFTPVNLPSNPDESYLDAA
jgi:hypothetical protein